MADLPEEAVQAAAEALLLKEWKPDTPWSIHKKHRFDSDCAVCGEDLPAIVAVALEAAAPVLAAQVRREAAEEQRAAGMVVVSAEDLRAAADVLATVNDPWRYISEEPELEARLRAVLPERSTDLA
jgi:hypothetical protein